MWRWIGVGVLVIIILLIGTCWYGFQKFTAGGGATQVAIGGSADRVWAALDHLDSVRTWATGDSIEPLTGPGPLVAGDSFIARPRNGRADRPLVIVWKVVEAVPGRARLLEARDDSTGQVLIHRRDSLVAVGDSTVLYTSFSMPLADSARAASERGGKGGGVSGFLLNTTARMMVAAMRTQAEFDLQRLKARLEGRAMPSPVEASSPRN